MWLRVVGYVHFRVLGFNRYISVNNIYYGHREHHQLPKVAASSLTYTKLVKLIERYTFIQALSSIWYFLNFTLVEVNINSFQFEG